MQAFLHLKAIFPLLFIGEATLYLQSLSLY